MCRNPPNKICVVPDVAIQSSITARGERTEAEPTQRVVNCEISIVPIFSGYRRILEGENYFRRHFRSFKLFQKNERSDICRPQYPKARQFGSILFGPSHSNWRVSGMRVREPFLRRHADKAAFFGFLTSRIWPTTERTPGATTAIQQSNEPR